MIGKQDSISSKGLIINVVIKDVKASYGHLRFKVSPVSGHGEKWTEGLRGRVGA